MNQTPSAENDATCDCGHSVAQHSSKDGWCLAEQGNCGSGSVADAVFCRCDSFVQARPTPPASTEV